MSAHTLSIALNVISSLGLLLAFGALATGVSLYLWARKGRPGR